MLETIDEETNLPNRRGFLFIAGRTLAPRDRAGEPAALLSLQLDHGRAALGTVQRRYARREFGRLLVESFRDSDVVARLQDDQFCVLMSPERPDDVDIPLGRLEAAVERWNRADNGTHGLGFRHHVTEIDAEDDVDLEGLLATAEEDRSGAEPAPTIGGAVSILRLVRKELD